MDMQNVKQGYIIVFPIEANIMEWVRACKVLIIVIVIS